MINKIRSLTHEEFGSTVCRMRKLGRKGKGQIYLDNIVKELFCIDNIFQYLRHILGRIKKEKDFYALQLDIINYVIIWCSVNDVLMRAISEIYDLGIHEKDINYTLLERNKHVPKEIFKILKTDGKKVYYNKIVGLRNEIIHHGEYGINELCKILGILSVEEVSSQYHSLAFRRFTSAPKVLKTEDLEYAQLYSNFNFQATLNLERHLFDTWEIIVSVFNFINDSYMKNKFAKHTSLDLDT